MLRHLLWATALVATPSLSWSQNQTADPEAAETALPEITVTADPFAQRNPVEATQPTAVLSGEDLERSRAATLGETLAEQPGVHSADFASGASRPVIRGLGGPRVRILDGGSRVADASTLSPDHNVAAEPFRARQIEVLKGPASLMYGSGAIGGVINLVSDLVPNTPENERHGALGAGANTVNGSRSGWGHVGGGNGRIAFHLDGLVRDSDDYDIPGLADADDAAEHSTPGRVENSASQTHSVGGGLSLTREQGYLGLGVSVYDTLYGVPGHSHGEDEHAENAETHSEADAESEQVRIDMQQQRYELRGGWNWSNGPFERIRGSLVHSTYEHQELEGQETGTLFDNELSELRVELTHRERAGWRGVAGVQASQQDFSALGDEAVVPPVQTHSTGIFLVEERHFSAHRLSLGARIEHLEHDPGALNRGAYNLLSLSSALHLELGPQQHLRVGLSRSERAPDVQELYSFGPHLATSSFDRGDGSLEKESALNLDLGWHAEIQQVSLAIDLFYTRYSDFIFSGEVDEDGDGEADRYDEEHSGDSEPEHDEHAEESLLIVQYQQDDARFWGGELDARYNVNRNHSVGLFGDVVRARRNDGGRLPRIPADRIGLRYDGYHNALSFGARLTRVLPQSRATALEGNTAGYTLLAADLAWSLVTATGELKLSLRGRNLLDEEARNHVSFLKQLAPLPGRNFGLGLEYSF